MLPFETLSHSGQVRRLRRLAIQALGDYPIGVARLAPLLHADNTTFRVEGADGARYALRIHRPTSKTPQFIRSELLWLAALRQNSDLMVPDPVATRSGDLLTSSGVPEVPEERTCVLLRWLPGRFVNAGLTPAHLRRVGTFMARLQDEAAGFTPPEGFVRGRLDNLYGKPRGVSARQARQSVDNPEDEAAALQLAAQACSAEDVQLVERMIQRVRAAQRRLGLGPASFGLIHGDLHQWNYLFHGGQVGAIDFDDCGYGHYLYDIAVTLFNIRFREDTPRLRAAFLEGYASVRPLPAGYDAYIDTFMDLRDIQMMVWAIEMRNHPAFRSTWEQEVRETLDYFRQVE